MPTKKSDNVPLMLRLPPDLHARVVALAEAQGKSMNEYIVNALSEYPELKIQNENSLIELDRRISEIEAKMLQQPPRPTP